MSKTPLQPDWKPRSLHFKRLGILLVVLIVLAGCAYKLHAFQVQRNARWLLDRSHKLDDEGRLDDAVESMRRYLKLEPSDNDALGDFGVLLARSAYKTGSPRAASQALFTLERAVRNSPNRTDTRLELVKLAIRPGLGRYKDARAHLKPLLGVKDDDPESWADNQELDPELVQLLGSCFEGERDYAKAVKCYERAIQRDPTLIDCYVRGARLLRKRLNNLAAAEDFMNDKNNGLLAKNPKSAAAFVAHARYSRESDKLEIAAKDLEAARSFAPDDVDVLLASADVATQQAFADIATKQQKLDEARKYLLQGIDAHPKYLQLHLAIHRLDVIANKPEDGIADLNRALEQLPEQPDLLWAMLDLKVDQGELEEAAGRIKRLRRRGYPEELLRFEEARIHVRNKEWLKATVILDQIAPIVSKSPAAEELAKRILLERAGCYQRLGKLDRRFELFHRWLDIDPYWQPARLGMAETLLAMGNLDEALDMYQRVVDDIPQVRFTIVRILIIRNLRRRMADREWGDVKRSLDDLAVKYPGSLEVLLLKAEVLADENPKDNCEKAAGLLASVLEYEPEFVRIPTFLDSLIVNVPALPNLDPKLLDVRLALATIAERQGNPVLALERLDETEKLLGDRVEIRLAKARFLSRRNDAQEHLRIKDLASDIEKFSKEEQAALMRGLGKALVACGEFDAARPLWNELAVREPYDLGVKLVLFDLARNAKDDDTMGRLLRELREKLEGADGSYWRYCEVCTLMKKALEGDEAARARAWQLLADLEKQRRSWGRIPALQGELYDAEQKSEQAMRYLKRAYELGERNPITTRRFLRLLLERHKYAEAKTVIAGLPEQTAISNDMQRIMAEIAFRTQEYTNAYEIALNVIPKDSRDYHDDLWLAGLARQVGKQEDAYRALEKAMEHGPDKPEVWVVVIDFLVATDRKTEALAKFEEAKKVLEQQPIALGVCYELVGDEKAARETFLKAAEDDSENPQTLTSVASFLLSHGEFKEATKKLEAVVKLKDKDPLLALNADRLLLQIDALTGPYEDSRQAVEKLSMLDADLPTDASPDERARNLRTKAVVLSAQPDLYKRKEAIKILEKMRLDEMSTPDDDFRLARLYDTVEPVVNWPRASALFQELLSNNRAGPAFLVDMAYRFLRHDERAQAEACVASLEKMEAGRPASFATVTLRALLLKSGGKKDQAADLLRALAKNDGTDARKLAMVMEDVDPKAAEDYYRDYVKNSGKPESKLSLALYLGRHKRCKEALDVCEECWKDCKPIDVGSTAVGIVLLSRAETDQSERVAKWLQAEIAKEKNPATLRVQLANLRTIQGEFKEAISIYRDLTAGSAPDAEALNNLAWLLAFQGGSKEALNLLDQAEKKAGPSPNWRDNRGLAYLKMDNYKDAIRDFEDAVAEQPNSTYYFHLAEAYFAAKKQPREVREALRNAEQLGLKEENLHPLERPDYRSLKTKLAD